MPPFDPQAAAEGYMPCARGERFCEMELVRPGKVQCACDDPHSRAARIRRIKEWAGFAKAPTGGDDDAA